MSAWVVVGIVIILIAGGVILYIIKQWNDAEDNDDRFTNWALLILSVIAIIITCIITGDTIVDAVYDLKNQAYVVCEGEFSVIDDAQTPSRACSLILNNGKRLECTAPVLKPGKYKGRIVYATRTEFILEFELFGENIH